MSSMVLAHARVHLAFLGRQRVYQALVVAVVLVLGLAIVTGSVVFDSASRFETLRALARALHATASLVTACTGLALVEAHRRSGAIRMVATSAAPFGAWVASLFVAAAVVGGAIHGIVAAMVFGLSWVWNVSYQTGFLYLAIDRFTESLIALAFLTTLDAAFGPALALCMFVLANDSALLALRSLLTAVSGGLVLDAIRWATTVVYYALPTFDPFGDRTNALMRTMRVADSDWRYLVATVAYSAVAVACGLTATLASLRRRLL